MEPNQEQNLEKPILKGLHEDIAELERKLAEKKKLAEISGVEVTHEKEIFKEVIREHVAEKKAEVSVLPPKEAEIHQKEVASGVKQLKKIAEEEQLQELINIAVIKNPIQAVHIAEHLKNPRLLDDLHDYLSDNLYDKLVEARKLREL